MMKVWLLLLACVASQLRLSTAQVTCAESLLDLVFAVDGSGSICDNDNTFDRPTNLCDNWKFVRGFMADVVELLNIGPTETQVGLSTFASNFKKEFDLDDFADKASLKEKLLNLEYPGGNTRTAQGIAIAREEILVPSGGRRDGVRCLMIIITDGIPTRPEPADFAVSEAKREAGLIQDECNMIAIGVTDLIQIDILEALSSQPRVEGLNYFPTTDFEALKDIVNALVEQTCATPAPDTGCGEAVIDLALVVDGSGSICDNDKEENKFFNSTGCVNWLLVREFVSNVIDRLPVGEDLSHISLITFANKGELIFDLAEFYNAGDMKNIISSLDYPGGRTNTYQALNILRNVVFAGGNGDRPGISNVALFITDGVPTLNEGLTQNEALLAQQGTTIYSFGITEEVDEETLKYLSSQPRIKDQQYFSSPDFNSLNIQLNSILTRACDTPAPVPATTPVPAPGCANPADVLFIVDASGSIGNTRFETMKAAVALMVDELSLETGQVRVALIVFSSSASIHCALDAHGTRAEWKANCIDNLAYTRGTTNTASALQMAIDQVFTQNNGDRIEVINIAVILTDGGSNDKRSTVTRAIEAKKVMTILAIGIGDWVDSHELRSIASDPYSINFWTVENFDQLKEDVFVTRIRNFLCDNTNECEPNPCQNGGVCVNKPGRYYCRCTNGFGGENCQYGCRAPANVVFALDASGSIGRDNFLKVIDFAKSVVRGLPVGQGTQVGLLTFGTETTKYFDLNEYSDMEGTMNGMSIPFFSGGTTNTAAALRLMRDSMFTDNAGVKNALPKIGVVLTDGRSNNLDETWREAIKDRDDGINIVAIGIGGNVRMSELVGMASYPTDSNVFTVDNFDSLSSVRDAVRGAVCNDEDECDPNPCQNQGQCTDLINGYYCTCGGDFTGVNCERGCSGELDVLFVIDRSGSVRHERYDDVKDMIANSVQQLETWNGKVRVAAIAFSDDAELIFRLNSYNSKQNIKEAIKRISYAGGRTNIASALETARIEVFQERYGDRQNVPNVLVLFSDGGANIREQETLKEAIADKIMGVHVIVAAVGKDLNMMELRGIASDPFSSNIHSVDSFSKIDQLEQLIVQGSCNDINECAENPCTNGGTCLDGWNKYDCLCTSDRTGRHCDRTCRRQYDLLFILDLSGSVDQVYEISMAFVKRLVYCLEFRFDIVRAAIISFSDDAEIKFHLNTYTDSRDILTALAFDRVGGRTNTQGALRLAIDEIFVENNGDRREVQNKVILLTDGGSNIQRAQTQVNAAELKNDGAQIHVVGIGDQIDINEINQIASGENQPWVFRASDTAEAEAAGEALCDSLCQ